jgi:spectinomycin phosphotransferase
VRTPPEDLDQGELAAALAEGWGLDVAGLEPVLVGGGSHHWVARERDGRRHFVTADDLDHKPWLGRDRDSTFAGLRAAFDTALALRDRAGLEFVLAPVSSRGGAAVRRLGPRYSVALFPFLDGSAGSFWDYATPDHAARLIPILVGLHRATPAARGVARHRRVPARADLDAALADADRPWAGGPFSEPARAWLAANAGPIHRALRTFDELAAQVGASDRDLVVTHGEPHPANLVRSGGRSYLIDWDTVGLAPPERDLWMLDGGPGDALAAYSEATGTVLDPSALALYRLSWDLTDLAMYASVLRGPHRRTADTELAWRAVTEGVRHTSGLL